MRLCAAVASLLFADPAPSEIYTLSLHDALPILKAGDSAPDFILPDAQRNPVRLYSLLREGHVVVVFYRGGDRKSTRLNSSHLGISYAVFCLKKKNRHMRTLCVARPSAAYCPLTW